MLVRNSSKPIEIPHEPGNSVIIRRVRREVLRKASDVRQENAIGKLKNLGGPTFIKELRSLNDAPKPEDGVTRKAASYDETTLLAAGVVGFSGPLYDGETMDEELLADLDDKTAEWICDRIVEYAESGELQTKND